MYKIIKNIIIAFVCHFLFHVKYENLEILDQYDQCLICPNHSRIFDPVFLFPKINNMYSVAKSEAFQNNEDNYKYNKRNTKSGAVYLSSITNIPIIPVHITQRPRFFSKVTVTFGYPFIPASNVSKDKALLKKEASRLIHRIYDL